MNPDESSRIASVIRALTNTVQPAIREDEALAQEQIQLAIGHLAILQAQMTHSHTFRADELSDRQQLAQTLLEITADQDLLKEPHTDLSRAIHEDDLLEISKAIQILIFAASTMNDSKAGHLIFETVLSYENARAQKDREWFAPMGFDAEFSSG